MEPGISVVIPNYNGVGLFPSTLPTVFAALEQSGLAYEVIICDDASTDGSIDHLARNFSAVKVIANEKNCGFSITANKGMRSARYDLALLLNSDVQLTPDYFLHQLPYFSNPDTFGVMGRIIGWTDDNIQDGAKYPSFHSAKIKTSVNYIVEDEAEREDGLYTMYLSGANALVDRRKFEMLGGFNELFSPFYVEDYELSLRAWRLGWFCYYEHEAVCRHQTSTTIKTKSRKSFIRMISNRNKWFLHAIHLGTGWRLLWLVQLLPEVFFQSLLLKGYYFKAFLLFLKKYGRVRASRRTFRQLAGNKKLLSVQEVARFIQNSIKDKRVKFFS
jgi:GT2 family glycosyltransferase